MKDKYNLSLEKNIFLAKRNIVDYIWQSANLEGIEITIEDAQTLYDSFSVIDVVNYKYELGRFWLNA